MTNQVPQHLFVGTHEGTPTCTPEPDTYDIWPKFLVMVLLQGAQRFLIDNTEFHVDAGFGEAASPRVLMLNVARFAKLRFINDSAVPLRKVMISAPLPWVERLKQSVTTGVQALTQFFDQHLADFRFEPAGQILTLAEQLMAPPPAMRGEVLALYRNSRALDIMCLACNRLAEEEEERLRPSLMKLRQCEQVRSYVLANLDRDLTIEEIARAAGASVSSIQRHFREQFGETVFEFVRRSRLALACDALERQGVSIAQAAHVAGYSDPSSFTAAFKRAYGVPPKCRRR